MTAGYGVYIEDNCGAQYGNWLRQYFKFDTIKSTYIYVMRSLWYVDLYIIGIEFSPRELLFIFEHLLLHRNECY